MMTLFQQAQAVGFNPFTMFAGLGIFLFGIKYMGDALKSLAGSKMKSLIDKHTTNPIKGVFVGAFVTAIIQSSSGTTALTISLVRAGLMSLPQAVGIIMGSNIGTTITAVFIGFKLSKYAGIFLVVGAFVLMLTKTKKNRHIGELLIGFGALFYGLDTMGGALKVLAAMPAFAQFAVELSNNKILGVIVGMLMTLLIQSSSATIGILQTLYSNGDIDLAGALPILFGDNIGTTITAILAAIGGAVAAKRAAAAHVMFNLIGTIVALIVFPFFLAFIVFASTKFNLNPEMQIAFAHAVFNIGTTLYLLPFIGVIVYSVTKIIPHQNDELEFGNLNLERGIIEESPELALDIANTATVTMSKVATKAFSVTTDYVLSGKHKLVSDFEQCESMIDDYDVKISRYLAEIGNKDISEEAAILQNKLIYVVKDLERIGDHSENLIEHFHSIFEAKEKFSAEGAEDLNKMFTLINDQLQNVVTLIDTQDLTHCETIFKQEASLDMLEEKAKEKHLRRFSKNLCEGDLSSMIFVDILSDLERIGDHCNNIAKIYISRNM